mmetsp:Transcript_34756/g.98638  ORF Transcript_34756/g.98638 Transcript_34756/m.98638 type:complete len:346 (+) Transcript_34756:44-1081(+)
MPAAAAASVPRGCSHSRSRSRSRGHGAPADIPAPLRVRALRLSGDVVGEVQADALDSVASIKRTFSALSGTPTKYLRLVCGPRVLEDEEQTLLDAGLQAAIDEDGIVDLNLLRLPVEAASLLAITEDDPRLVLFLVECGADPNEMDELGWTALHWAAHRNLVTVGDAVLALPGFEAADAQDIGKMTALHSFAHHGLAGLCQALASRSDFTKLNARGPNGNTALHWAARNAHEEACEVLLRLEGFTAVNEQNMHGWTALHYAAAAGLHRVCELIIAHPCFQAVAEVTNNGETALHWAAMNGRLDVCKLLVKDGLIDASVPDVEGTIAVDGARTHGYEAICELLTAC